MLTEDQKELISYLKAIGYGWRKFAVSVEKQGWCSEKQYEILRSMKTKVKNHSPLYRSRYNEYEVIGSIGCSDSEAMSFGEYF